MVTAALTLSTMRASLRSLGGLLYGRCMSTEVAASVERPSHYRTLNCDPSRHTASDHGLVFGVPEELRGRVFGVLGLTVRQAELCRTLGEMAVLVRAPAQRVISCLRDEDTSPLPQSSHSPQAATEAGDQQQEEECLDSLLAPDENSSDEPHLPATAAGVRPSRRFVFYGYYGVGKLTCLQHVIMASVNMGRILIHLPRLDAWGTSFHHSTYLAAESLRDTDLLEHSLEAAQWLSHFLHQNGGPRQRQQLEQLPCQQLYEWSQRERTEVGAPLWQLAEFGVARPRFAPRCMSALMEELADHAATGRCRPLVAVERVNALWTPGASHLWEDRAAGVRLSYRRFAALQGLWRLLGADFNGGDVVTTLSVVDYFKRPPQHYLPVHMLGLEGWNHMEPFVPLTVDNMDRRETYNLLDYLDQAGWIHNPVARSVPGKQQLFMLSGGNPRRLMELLCLC